MTWYKDGVQIVDREKGQNLLTLSKVGETDKGMYKCAGKSHTPMDETTIEVTFYGIFKN